MTAELHHRLLRNSPFPRQNLGQIRRTKAALAASHPGAGAALDRIQRARRRILMDGGDDFPLGHRFTAADDMAIARILCDHPVLCRRIQRMEDTARRPFRPEIRLFPQDQTGLRKPADQLLRNRRRRR